MPNVLTDGQITLQVIVIDAISGNASDPSNAVTVTIVSIASDYNGDSYSDAALWSPDTTTNQGLWLVQNTTETPTTPTPPPFWFTSGTAFGPTNVVPFQGDFDGDGQADLAYYNLATATWYMNDSKQDSCRSRWARRTRAFRWLATLTPIFRKRPRFTLSSMARGHGASTPESLVFALCCSVRLATSRFRATTPASVMMRWPSIGPAPGSSWFKSPELMVRRPRSSRLPAGTPDLSSLVPVPGNYDPYLNTATPPAWVENTEAAWYDPKTGVYTIQGPNGAYSNVGRVPAVDVPVPADYAGFGSTQPTVFRPSTGQFIALGGTVIATFGTQASNDIPLAAPLSYRMPVDPPSTGTGGSTGTGSTGAPAQVVQQVPARVVQRARVQPAPARVV